MAKRKVKKDTNILNEINKKYGDGSIVKLGDAPIEKVEVVSSGSIGLDIALGTGGIPRGRLIEIFGKEMSAKTTLAFHIIANAQKDGIECAFIDAEHALDIEYAERLGVDIKNLLISQPDYGEQGLNIAEDLIEFSDVGYIVIDSVAALVPKKELEGEVGDHSVGLQARMMSQACRKFAGLCKRGNTSVIFINQLREKIGVMFGNPEVTPGGRALKFYSTVRIEMKAGEKIKNQKGELIASNIKLYVVKNKLAPPFRRSEIKVEYGKGFDVWDEVVGMLIDLEKVKVTSGGWHEFKGLKVKGRQNFVIKMQEKFADKYSYFVEQIIKLIEKQ